MTEHVGSEAPLPHGGERFGGYALLRKLGQGGMAEIYLAVKPGLAGIKQIVVIKRIRTDQAGNRDLIKMFLEEARIASTLSHPNICQIHEVGEVNGRHYLAMEYLHGEDVRAMCRRLAKMRHPLPIEHSLAIVVQTASGLHYAHARTDLGGKPLKIVHRDVSPQNMFVTFDGTVKLLDFGIAKAENRAGGIETVSGVIKGKLTYMSPEQVQGLPLTQASDVYALGIVLWELTTGRRLFKADTDYKVLKKIVDEPVPTPRSVWADYYPDLEAIVMKALARDVTQRYQTARELQSDLQAFARREGLLSSDLELSSFMQEVFAERLAEERAARESGRELYEVLRDRDWSDSGVSSAGDEHAAGTGPGVRPEDTGPSHARRAPQVEDDPNAPELPEPTKVTQSGPPSTGGKSAKTTKPSTAASRASSRTGATGALEAVEVPGGRRSPLLVVALVGLGILLAAGIVGAIVMSGMSSGDEDERSIIVDEDGVPAGKKAKRPDGADKGRLADDRADGDEDPRGPRSAGARPDGPATAATSLPDGPTEISAAPGTAAPATGKKKPGKKGGSAAPGTAGGVGSDLEDWGR